MIITVTSRMFRDEFTDSSYRNNFSRWGLDALFNYFEELEADTGTQVELDVCSIACDYCESTAESIHSRYDTGIDLDPANKTDEEFTAELREWLEYRTTVVAVSDDGDTFLYVNF